MTTVEPENRHDAFAVWVTGLPASGKSTLVASLRERLAARGIQAAVLESDVMRKILTPQPSYDDAERDRFYGQMASLGALLIRQGVPVIFDATANRRAYRDAARRQITRFLEVYLDCPLEVCVARDPKGIYRSAQAGSTADVPGVQAPYEPPEHPDVVAPCGQAPELSAVAIVAKLEERKFL
jgi:adenylylsulfate kinase